MRSKVLVWAFLAALVAGCQSNIQQPRMSYAELTSKLGQPNERRSYSDGSTIVTYNNVNYKKLFPELSKFDGYISMTFEFDKSGFCTPISDVSWSWSMKDPSSFGQGGNTPKMPDIGSLRERVGHCGLSEDGTGLVPIKDKESH